MKILENATQDSEGEPVVFPGGLATVYCWGVFAGATLKLSISPDKTNWFDMDGFTLSGPIKPKNLQISDCWLKGQVIGGGPNTNINLMLKNFNT
mgnify:CR=1 FL=1